MGGEMKGDLIEVEVEVRKEGEIVVMDDEKVEGRREGWGFVKDMGGGWGKVRDNE
ncbi:hypothetical protein [Bacillus velezensis]|uniref:hypothetical protein n=1 Tax=Bacillus velezensis TaxID=492670 RepID=UPI001643BF92|nr:hypothetical protein [Bacillus velezensis]